MPEGFRSLATPMYRGSTTLFSDAGDVTDDWNQYEVGYTYGLYGTPTTLELAAQDLRARRRLSHADHARRPVRHLDYQLRVS